MSISLMDYFSSPKMNPKAEEFAELVHYRKVGAKIMSVSMTCFSGVFILVLLCFQVMEPERERDSVIFLGILGALFPLLSLQSRFPSVQKLGLNSLWLIYPAFAGVATYVNGADFMHMSMLVPLCAFVWFPKFQALGLVLMCMATAVVAMNLPGSAFVLNEVSALLAITNLASLACTFILFGYFETMQTKLGNTLVDREQTLRDLNHELRTPLSGLRAIGTLVRDNAAKGESIAEYIEAHKTLLTQISSLLDRSRQLGEDCLNSPVKLASLDAEHLLCQVASMFNPMAKERGIRINVNVAPGTPVNIVSDEIKLKQILANLVSNAVKYSQGSAIELSCSLVQTEQGDMAHICVQDNGVGLPETQGQAVLGLVTKFTQQDARSSSGLGMNICKGLASQLGGSLRFDSAANHGTRCCLELPLLKPLQSVS